MANAVYLFLLIEVGWDLVELVVDARGEFEVYSTLESADTGKHAYDVVVLRFLEVGVLFLHQEFGGFEIVVRIELVAK